MFSHHCFKKWEFPWRLIFIYFGNNKNQHKWVLGKEIPISISHDLHGSSLVLSTVLFTCLVFQKKIKWISMSLCAHIHLFQEYVLLPLGAKPRFKLQGFCRLVKQTDVYHTMYVYLTMHYSEMKCACLVYQETYCLSLKCRRPDWKGTACSRNGQRTECWGIGHSFYFVGNPIRVGRHVSSAAVSLALTVVCPMLHLIESWGF